MSSLSNVWDHIKSLGVHFYSISDEKLKLGNKVCKPYQKITLDNDDVELDRDLTCNDFGCEATFNSQTELEVHQKTRHTHVCSACNMIFPTYHLLDRHLLEIHDSFFQIAAQKKPMYACFIESCSKVFKTPQERKHHCISVHKFPADFRYDTQWRNLKSLKSKRYDYYLEKQIAKLKLNQDSKMECTNEAEIASSSSSNQMETTDITENRSSILESRNMEGEICTKAKTKVPLVFSFGAEVPRAFSATSKHQRHRKTKGPDISLKEMNEALDEMQT